jgi:glycine oxidase
MLAVNDPDAVIIGAGIIGVSCALALADAGLRVAVFDRQTPGCEASWAAGGMLSSAPYLPGDEALVPLAAESLGLYPGFAHAIESASQKSTHFSACGAIELFFGPEAPGERDRYVDVCRSLGLESQAISASDARRREPAIASSARSAALFPSEAIVEPRALMDAALEAARVSGVEIRPNARVQSLAFERNRCTGIVVENERIDAGHVVLAAGSFSQQILATDTAIGRQLAALVPTHPVRGQMIALRPRDTTLAVAVRSSHGYLVPRHNGTIVAGSTLEDAGFDKHTTVDGIAKIRRAAIEMIPGLMDAEIAESWCGLRPGTPDGLPILGPVDVKSLTIATGHFRNGILLAPITARLVCDWLVRGKTRFGADAYSPMRFAASAAEAQHAR